MINEKETTMKTKSKNLKLNALGLVLFAGLAAQVIGPQASAFDPLLDDARRSLNSPQIDIDGRYSQPRPQLDKKRRELEQQNEQMVQQRIEDIRVRQEQELAKNLQEAFTRGMQMGGDAVSTTQAAPQVQAPVPTQTIEDNRIITGFGVTNASGDFIDFESKIDARLEFETQLNHRFAVGVGVGYLTMDIRDMNPNNQSYQNMANFYRPWGYNSFYQQHGREMDYKELNIDLNGKFYVVPHSKIRPFVGLGLGYKRSSLRYANDNMNYNTFSPYQAQVSGEEKYGANYVTARASMGTDINFTSMIGARLHLTYSKGLTSGESGAEFTQSLGEYYLRNVGKNLANADFFGLGAGLIINF